MEAILQDLRDVARRLGRSPRFPLAAVSLLAVGLGANGSCFQGICGLAMGTRISTARRERYVFLGLRLGGAGQPSCSCAIRLITSS